MLRRVLNEMRYSRCHFLDFPPFDRVDRVHMVAHFCRKGSKAFHATWSRNLYERQRQMEYILSCAIRSQEGLCSSNFHIHLASRAGQLRTYHLEKNWNDGKIIIEYNLPLRKAVSCISTTHASSELIQEKNMKHDFISNWMKRVAAICLI